jgi:hypothetical protein
MRRQPNKSRRKPAKPVPAAITTPVPTAPVPTGFVWGAFEIGEVIGRNARQTHHLASTGKLKSVRKVGSQWCANVDALLAELRCEDAA